MGMRGRIPAGFSNQLANILFEYGITPDSEVSKETLIRQIMMEMYGKEK